MKQFVPALLFFLSFLTLSSQTLNEAMEGKVSYVTSQNIYVKFQSTENIAKGDTLYIRQEGTLVPALIVQDISSISCVCIAFSSRKFSVSDLVISGRKGIQQEKKDSQSTIPVLPVIPGGKDTISAKQEQPRKSVQAISGNISVSSYLNFSNVTANSQRMRYSFSMNAQNIGNSKLSAEVYIDFVHKLGDWTTVQNDIFNGLKIYSLAVSYDFGKHNKIWLGRKINPRISNAGAIDGLQYELKAGWFTLGLFAGTRPDYKNYSFNANLFQAGGYVGHDLSGKNGNMQTTLAFINQTNGGMTDRRFAYLQHTNALVRNLFFFGSVEVSLYNKSIIYPVDTIQKDTTYKKDNSPVLSNLYLSLRYRPVRQLSLSISYSALKNIVYYETYPKNIVEKMLELSSVQGFMFQANYQPVKLLSIGLSAGYRSSKQDPKPSKNFYGYVTWSRVPWINISATLSATLLETSYISGKIFGLGISRDLVPGKLSGGLDYKYVSYNFANGESKLIQNMAEFNLTWRILKKLYCSLYFEGTFDKNSIFNRVYMNITQRF